VQRHIIKKTQSLSPISHKEIDAEVVLEGSKVYLDKQDEKGNKYHTLIDPDYDFYRRMTSETLPEQVDPNGILMYISNRCNLSCPLCYEHGSIAEEPSFDAIKRIVEKHPLKNIVLMGKEPTCREDIVEIVKMASQRNRCVLLTNGIKLANFDYARKLKDAGLVSITFSFNGFDDEIYKEMNGRPLLDLKLKALDNIKRLGITTIISVTLNRGTNEEQIKKIFDYCSDNHSFIAELRIRTASKVGAHLEVEPFCMSELIDLFSRAVGISKTNLYREQALWTEISKELAPLVPPNFKAFAKPRLCCFYFHVFKSNGKYTTFDRSVDIEAIQKSKLRKARLVYELIRGYGVRHVIESAASYLWPKTISTRKLPVMLRPKTQDLLVVLRSWPNIYNIDLVENRKCPSQYYKGGVSLPFCYANILNDVPRIQSQPTQPDNYSGNGETVP